MSDDQPSAHGRMAGHRPDLLRDRHRPFPDMKDADPMTQMAADTGTTARLAQDFDPDHMTRVNRARRRDAFIRRAFTWAYVILTALACAFGVALALTSKI